jgi:DNA-binding transcriptional LysR family regulator
MQTPLFDLPGLIARYQSAYPRIELRIRQAGSTELGRLLGERSVDVIFRAVADESTGFVSIPLACSRLAVVCSAGQALAGTAEVDLRDLSDRALRSRGVEPRYAFEVNDTRTLGLDGPCRGARSGTVEPRRPSAVDDAS